MNYRGLFLASLMAITPCALSAPHGATPAEEARKLLAAGKEAEAFLKYLSTPGCEHAAVAVAKARPEEFLAVLKDKAKDLCRPRATLVEGDLRLAAGKKAEALACYRAVAAAFAAADANGWDQGLAPRDWYYAEPPGRRAADSYVGRSPGDACPPMRHGPGSHRDNWLVRRFLALESWDDAAGEFARVWEIHRRATQPYVVRREVNKDGQPFARWVLIEPAGFGGKGLQFALDYAFFLKTRKDWPKAMEVLLTPLAVMDMNRNADLEQAVRVVSDDEAARLPHRSDDGRSAWGHRAEFSPGVSRKEFLRLAYGLFKAAGKEGDFLKAIQGPLDRGDNRARLVLARVLTMAGKADDAIGLELAHIDHAKLGAYAAAYCRGMVYDRYGRPAEAIREYEKALALPPAPLPDVDADEDAVDRSFHSSAYVFLPGGRSSWRLVEAEAAAMPSTRPAATAPARSPGPVEPGIDSSLVDRLRRLYSAAGRADRVLELSLLESEKSPGLATQWRNVEELQARFRAAGKEADFQAWAQARLAKADDLPTRMNLLWLTGRQNEAIEELIQAVRQKKPTQSIETQYDWTQRIQQADKAAWGRLRRAIAQAHPEDVYLRLSLLAEDGVTEGEVLVKALEDLLDPNAAIGFYDRRTDPPLAGDPFVVAYRLMRLYEKAGQTDRLIAMGLRVARGDKKFAAGRDETWRYRGENKAPEYAAACLALLIQHAGDDKTRPAVEEALKACPWPGAREQWARRRAGGIKPPRDLTPIGWANAPEGVTLLASNTDVHALARDDRHVYAGHPWGVAVYDLQGRPVTRIALGASIGTLAVHGGWLWAGSAEGLYRIDPVKHEAAFLPIREVAMSGPGSGGSPRAVRALAGKGDRLWVCTSHDVRCLDLKAGSQRVFTPIDLGDGHSWDRILLDGDDVWIDGGSGCLRYEAKSDTWSRPRAQEAGRLVRLIGVIDGELWGHVWLNDRLRDRPCLIDRRTLDVAPILIDGLGENDGCFNGPFFWLGRSRGQLVFSEGHRLFAYDARSRRLRPLDNDGEKPPQIDSDVPEGLRSAVVWRDPDGTLRATDNQTHHHKVGPAPFHTGTWTMLTLPDGRKVLGGRMFGVTSDPDDGHFWELGPDTDTSQGGLYFVTPAGGLQKFAYASRSDVLAADYVFGAISDPKVAPGTWLYTEMGLAVLDDQFHAVRALTRDDGLAANLIASGASLGGRLYFSAGWGDAGGGLIVFDPATAVFTTILVSDGLSSNKLASVAAEDGRLKITYGYEYLTRVRHPGVDARDGYLRCAPGAYDPATGKFTSSGPPVLNPKTERDRSEPKPAMPILGGRVNATVAIGDKTVYCGTRGVLVCGTKDEPRGLTFKPLEFRETLSEASRQVIQAAGRKYAFRDPNDLAEALKDANPYCRAKALAAIRTSPATAVDDCVDQIAAQLDGPILRLRSTAACLLLDVKDHAKALPCFRKLSKDPDRLLRALATIGQARCGERPDPNLVRELLAGANSFGNTPFGADSTAGIVPNHQTAYLALAPLADEETLPVMLEHPYYYVDSHYEPIYRALGESLRRHPRAAETLLKAYDADSGQGHVRFARDVFRHAGKDLLPVLHKALASDDRVVRSNAALACGAIGEASSIAPLIAALDLESGLSRASIVQALGELKAAQAVPQLAGLYLDALRDEKRRRGAGYRHSQLASAITAEYETIANLDSIVGEWNELRASTRPATLDPRRNEPLLEPEHIREAVRKIGPAGAQDWYRALAAGEDVQGRLAAAACLAEGAAADAEKNIPILRNLRLDPDPQVRMAATVSLLILGQQDMREPILGWLKSENEALRILEQLPRVKDKDALAFCRPALAELASDKNRNEYVQRAARKVLGN